jgi:choline dehydrogenase
VMPTVVSGNTNAASIMIGERGSDAVLGKRLPRKSSLERPVRAMA